MTVTDAPAGWTFEGQPTSLLGAGPAVTLIDGATFCLSTRAGTLVSGFAQGLFVRDTRFVSGWLLEVDGEQPEPLAVDSQEAFAATFVTRVQPPAGSADSSLLVVRNRTVADGMHEDLVVRNVARHPVTATVTLTLDADFADLFEVKEGRVPPGLTAGWSVRGDTLVAESSRDRLRSLHVSSAGADLSPGLLQWKVALDPWQHWSTCVHADPVIGGVVLPVRHPCDGPVERTAPAHRLRAWRSERLVVDSAHDGLLAALRASVRDLGSLRIVDLEQPELVSVAAGAPWFMTMFGRDSILTSLMSLLLDPSLALGTLRTLARLQGTRVDPVSEEQPGRIMHEVRFGTDAASSLGGRSVYYGTADATPLFVMLLGELRRWGIGDEDVALLLPHADRALEWIDRYGDRDGDGFVEYARLTDRGLANQGWKDSFDGVNFADGRIAEAPIALCEVQGYVYAAFVARAHFAHEAGEIDLAGYWIDRAATLKRAFNDRFWLPDRDWFAIGLDRDKRPIDALTSNIGHCLWTGIIDEDKAARVAEHLMSPDMFTGWGVRTLAASMAAYNPMSYHNGSVWPHDNAIIAAGLMRYGFVAEAQRIALGMLDAAGRVDGRLPELFCGFDRSDFTMPLPYPTSCSPQAWASAAPISLLRTLLRFDPATPQGRLWLSPVLPAALLPTRVGNITMAGSRVTVDAQADGWTVRGTPAELDVVRRERHPLAFEGGLDF